MSFLSNTPSLIVKGLIRLKNDFLWNGKPPKIKHKALIGSYERGGLKDIDIENRIKALKLSWVKRLYDDNEHEWKIIPKFYLQKFSDNIFYPNLKVDVRSKIPMFYKNVIQEWEQISNCIPITMENVLVQPIKYNRYILIGGNIVTWNDASGLFVQNFYSEEGQILDWRDFRLKNDKGDNFYFKWRQILNAIPREWRDKIGTGISECSVVPEPHLQVISRRLNLERLSGKELYIILINKIWERPTSEAKIEQVLGASDLNWARIYVMGRKITIDSYLRMFSFKLNHNILFLNKALKKMKLVESSLCSYCGIAEETPIHLFSDCKIVIEIWRKIQLFFRSSIVLADLTPQSAILGWLIEDDLILIKNLILLIFKVVVYKDRELGVCSIERFLNKLRKIMIIEHNLSTNQEYNKKKWDSIRGLLE